MRTPTYFAILFFVLFPRLSFAVTVDLNITAIGTNPLNQGDTVTYSYIVTNSSVTEDATGVIFSTALPTGLIFSSITSPEGSCSPGATIICTIPVIAKLDLATIEIKALINEFGSSTHTAIVTSDQVEANPADNSVQLSTTLTDTRLESSAAGSCDFALVLFLILMLRFIYASKPRQISMEIIKQ